MDVTDPTPSENQKQDLLIAVVQGQDADNAIQTLADAGFGVTRLPSVGGFLGRKNATLMLGVTAEKADEAVELLNQTCRQRVAFIAVPMENAPLPMPAPTPVTIGGANVFALEVEHYEEF
jgi:uncharacterized protein YaaQ